MNAYVLQTINKLAPFYDYPKDCLIGNKKLGLIQRNTLESLNLDIVYISDINEIEDLNDYIVLSDNLYFTKKLLAEFIFKSKSKKRNTVCSLEKGLLTQRTSVVLQDIKMCPHHVEYKLWYFDSSGDKKIDPIAMNIDIGDDVEIISLPDHMNNGDDYLIPLTEKLIIQIDHWVCLWEANVLSILSNIAVVLNSPKKKIALAIKALSFNQWNVLGAFNSIGNNCDIHPKAGCVEGSIIGNNVTIKAGAIVRESIIGDGTVIGNNVVVESSVIGNNCSIMHGHILYSVMLANVFSFTQMISASLIGRDSFIGSGVVLTDFRFDNKNVTVDKDDSHVDSGNIFTGSCLGHGVYLGSGTIINPGRIIKNNTRMLPQ